MPAPAAPAASSCWRLFGDCDQSGRQGREPPAPALRSAVRAPCSARFALLGRVACCRLLHARRRARAALRFAQPYLGFEWIEAGGFRVPLNLLLDPLSAVMILVVTGVGSLIHIYSLGYMAHDEERVRYFSYLNLFTFFMLLLVLGGNLPLMFVGWEGVGLCSYLLIGFWFKKKSASDAGKKAFIVNRIGDAGLILGMILAFHALRHASTSWTSPTTPARWPAEALGQFGPRSPSSACCCSSAPAARARRSRCTSGCPTPWKARRRSRR